MNFKLLFPTYRAREQYIRATLAELASSRAPRGSAGPAFERALDVGCGEGSCTHASRSTPACSTPVTCTPVTWRARPR